MKKIQSLLLSLGIISLGFLGVNTTSHAAINKNQNKSTIEKKTKQTKSSQSRNKTSVIKKNNNRFKQTYRTNNFSSIQNIKYAVFNYENGKVYESNSMDVVWPVASLTKLMTAQVFLDNHPNLENCSATITEADIDNIKGTGTKLGFNKPYSCINLLQVMLVASDNYAASALSRSVPGWSKAKFVNEMNKTAKEFGLQNTNFVDSSGLSPMNRSSVSDYAKLTMHVVRNQVISDLSSSEFVYSNNKWNQKILYRNSNRLIRLNGFDTELSKTGYIRESGYNLVHLADCKNNIGVIEFGARSSEQRSNFVKDKLSKYGCAS